MARSYNRRQFLGTIATGAAGLAAAGSLLGRWAAAQTDGPNVLFIPVDDLNDWIGCLGGHPQVQTPNLDALASRGVLFTHAYCTAPACNPSRASLMSGIRPSTSGVYLNSQPWRPAMPSAVTMQELFMAQGYRTIGRGKVYHDNVFVEPDRWHEYVGKGEDPMPVGRPLNGIPDAAQFDWGPVPVPDDQMDDSKVATWGVEQLQGGLPDPFFLACGFFRPHLPWYVPQRYFDMYPVEGIALPNVNENDLDDIPPAGVKMARPNRDHKRVIETDNWRRAVQGYLACISFVDTQIGRLLDALYASPYADETVICMWGDHGWHLGEKLHWRKFALWEEATHAPLMIAGPGIAPGRCDRVVSFLDVYPTLVDLCGLTPPPEGQLEGVSLRPLLEQPSLPWNRPALTTHGRMNHSVRSESWRYIRYADGSEELYDEVNDPLEWTNLAAVAEHAQVKTDLAAHLPTVDAENVPKQAGVGD